MASGWMRKTSCGKTGGFETVSRTYPWRVRLFINAIMFRSCSVSLVQIYVPSEAAKLTVSMLGELGVVQFKDVGHDLIIF